MGNKFSFRFFKKIHCKIRGHNWNDELLDIEVQINPTTRRFLFGSHICCRCKFGNVRLIVDVKMPTNAPSIFPLSPDLVTKDQDIIAEEITK